MTKDYKIGRGKPPVQHQFKKGQSGNPSGKKKGKTLAQYITEAGEESRTFLRNGQQVSMPANQALAGKIYSDSLKGKYAATKFAFEADKSAMGDMTSAVSALLGPEEIEVAQTHADWLKLIEDLQKEQDDADAEV